MVAADDVLDALAGPWRVVDGPVEVLAIPRRTFIRSVLFDHWYHQPSSHQPPGPSQQPAIL